jgi:hypothetical protein
VIALAVILPLVLQAADVSAPPVPGLEAARSYAECLGRTAALNGLWHSVDYAVEGAFKTCLPRRQVAAAAIAEHFKNMGMNATRANAEAEDLLHHSDQVMAVKIRADIAAYEKAGKVPNAQHQ